MNITILCAGNLKEKYLKDVKIIGKTVKQVFLKDGINMSEEEPMEEFKGSRSV